MWPVVKARARFDSIPRIGLVIQHVAKAAVLSLSVLLPWQLPAQWLLLPEERAVHPKSGAFLHWVFILLAFVHFFKKDSTWKHSLELCETIAAALFGIANTSLQHVVAANHYKSVCWGCCPRRSGPWWEGCWHRPWHHEFRCGCYGGSEA